MFEATSAIRPAIRPAINPAIRQAFERGLGSSLASRAAALFAAKSEIQQNAGDVSLLVIGDSTGNETTEWVYLFAQWLGTQYPTHSVSYRLWNDGTNVYNAATVVSTGSGANTIRIWNASIAGTQPLYLMGSKLAPTIGVTPAPKLVIWNHGKNLTSAGADSLYRGGFIQAMDQVRLALPGVAHAAMRQSPNRDDSTMAPVVAQLDGLMTDYRDVAPIDVYSKFIAAGKPAGWYADNVHPSSTGSQLGYALAMQEAWSASAYAGASAFDAFVSSVGANLLTGITKFSDPAYVGGQPSGWINATTTMTVDTTIKDVGAAQSMKFVNAAGAPIYEQLSATALRGKTVTYAVRQYVPAGMSATTGRIAVLVNNGANTTVTIGSVGNQANDGWRWLVIAGVAIPADAIYLRAYLYCDSAPNAGSTVYYDRAILVEGNIPRNIA